MSKITQFKIFGERHTATNAVSSFLVQNFPVPSMYYDYLGWKHRLAPKEAEWTKHHAEQTLFIFTTRNPYTWLKAMHRQPYYYHQPQIAQLRFRDFILHSVEDYENYIQMWNLKNESYLRMCSEVPNGLIVRMEDFLIDQKSVFDRTKEFVPPRDDFQPFEKYVGGFGVENKPLSSTGKLPQVPDTTYAIINEGLSKRLMQTLGYEYAWSSSQY